MSASLKILYTSMALTVLLGVNAFKKVRELEEKVAAAASFTQIGKSGDCDGVTVKFNGPALQINAPGAGSRRVDVYDAATVVLGKWDDTSKVVTTPEADAKTISFPADPNNPLKLCTFKVTFPGMKK